MNENSHLKFVCMWSSCEHMFNMRSFNLMNQKVVNCVTYDLFSSSFSFHLQLLNIVWMVWCTQFLR